jgi:hypothetical protein
MPGLVELCSPHLVHALVIGATERHGRSKPNVEIAEIFESAYQFLGRPWEDFSPLRTIRFSK